MSGTIFSVTGALRELRREIMRRPAPAIWWIGQIAIGLGTVTALGSLLVGLVSKPIAIPALSDLFVLHEWNESRQSERVVLTDAEADRSWRDPGSAVESFAAYAKFDEDLQQRERRLQITTECGLLAGGIPAGQHGGVMRGEAFAVPFRKPRFVSERVDDQSPIRLLGGALCRGHVDPGREARDGG